MKKHIFLSLVLLVATIAPVRAIETASQVLAKCATALSQAPSLSATVSVTASGESIDMTMLISQQRFMLESPQMALWYDGVTQWTYDKDSREVNITEPTPDELLECNPFAIINYYSKAYTTRRLAGDGTVVELASKSRSANVRRAVITIDESTNMPSKIVLTMSSGHTMVAVVKSIKRGANVPDARFRYDRSKYPASEIIDLR